MGNLTPHFGTDEFKDKRANAHAVVPLQLVGALEHLRGAVGRPLVILSGYRTHATNQAVGGAVGSRHLVGDAVDIPEGYATLRQAEEAGFVGIGTKGQWAIHVDVRPGPAARWSY
jgi:uncharacterized protein YcbK (DUF882 family)